jgi:hypothetical protein
MVFRGLKLNNSRFGYFVDCIYHINLQIKLKSSPLRSLRWLGWPVWNICVTNDHGYVPLDGYISRSFPHSWFVIGFVTKLTRLVPLVERELPVLPQHLSSPRFLVELALLDLYLYVYVLWIVICPFSFGHCVVCSSSIYGFWLPLWYLQTLLIFYSRRGVC